MTIDLRSDTVTKPTAQMKEAMWEAEVGDDVLGDDPTVNALQEKTARLFGMEDALFCASGTLTNQLAIRAHTQPGSDVICDKNSHIYLYEGGGIMLNSLSSVKLLDGNRGRITAQQISDAISPEDDIHSTVTRLISLENTMNKGGGAYYDINEIKSIRQICWDRKIPLHLDGARLFNALVETGETPRQYGQLFDSISICLSKGLGCPVGSLLLGSRQVITKARRFRKVMGGGWRQAGFLAAAGMYALQNNITRLEEDHKRAKELASVLQKLPWVEKVEPVETNILIFSVKLPLNDKIVIEKLKQKNIFISSMGHGKLRIVTHLDYKQVMHTYVLEVLSKMEF